MGCVWCGFMCCVCRLWVCVGDSVRGSMAVVGMLYGFIVGFLSLLLGVGFCFVLVSVYRGCVDV